MRHERGKRRIRPAGGRALGAALVLTGLGVPALISGAVSVDGPPSADWSPASGPSGVHDVGPPPGVTGGFGEPTCQNCHTGEPVNAYGGSVTVEGLPEAFEPGRSYPLTVVLSAEGTVLAGYQLTARFAEGDRAGQPAGVLSPVDGGSTVTTGENGQPYLHQTGAGAVPESEAGTTWTVEWRAPGDGGAVLFHVAANSANGDQSPLLDLVYATELRVEATAAR